MSEPRSAAICDGSNKCKAGRHLHGCYSDDGTNCDHPSEHPLSSHWQELPAKYGPDAWELRVCDDHWYRVFDTLIVLCPNGLGYGKKSTTEEAKLAAESLYRSGLGRAAADATSGLEKLNG